MKAVSEATLQKTVAAYMDAMIAKQKDVRNYWAGKHDTGEGNSFLYANNLIVAQEGLDYLLRAKRGVTCEGCTVRSKAVSLELEVSLLQQELKNLKS